MKKIAQCVANDRSTGAIMKSKDIGVLRETLQCPSDGELSMGRKKAVAIRFLRSVSCIPLHKGLTEGICNPNAYANGLRKRLSFLPLWVEKEVFL